MLLVITAVPLGLGDQGSGVQRVRATKICFDAKNSNSLEPTHAALAYCMLRG